MSVKKHWICSECGTHVGDQSEAPQINATLAYVNAGDCKQCVKPVGVTDDQRLDLVKRMIKSELVRHQSTLDNAKSNALDVLQRAVSHPDNLLSALRSTAVATARSEVILTLQDILKALEG